MNLQQQINELRDDVKDLKDNHLFHLSEDVAIIKTKMSTIEWLGKAIGGLSIASLAGSILNLVLK